MLIEPKGTLNTGKVVKDTCSMPFGGIHGNYTDRVRFFVFIFTSLMIRFPVDDSGILINPKLLHKTALQDL